MYRFFVNKKKNNKFELPKDVLQHIKSIRLKPNEKFYCNYESEYYICHLENGEAIIEQKTNIFNELPNNIVLFASIIELKRFEWLIQKATELGVKTIYPMISKNTNVKNIEKIKIKINRLKEISKNACEQSFRNFLVDIKDPIYFDEAIKFEIKNKYIAHEKEENNNVDILFDGDVAFYVGPEGGFEQSEIDKAIKNNINVISLGKKILRSETASIFLLSRIKFNS